MLSKHKVLCIIFSCAFLRFEVAAQGPHDPCNVCGALDCTIDTPDAFFGGQFELSCGDLFEAGLLGFIPSDVCTAVQEAPDQLIPECGCNCPANKKKTSLPCFSGSNIVKVQHKGLITMDTLKIGDLVKTGSNQVGKSEYLPVISFMHMFHHAEVEYRQIYTNASPTEPLEISGDHFLSLHDDTVVRARDVQVGDILKGDAGADMAVTHIQNIQRRGLYAPATENGKIGCPA
jgi:hypothetical protein